MYYLIAFGVALLTFGLLWLLDRKFKANMSIVMKIISIFLILIFFVMYLIPGKVPGLDEMFSGSAIREFVKPNSGDGISDRLKAIFGAFVSQKTIIIVMIAVWIFVILHAIFVLLPFFKDKFRIAKLVEKFVAPPLLVFDIITIPLIVRNFSGLASFTVVGLFIAIEIGLILGELVFSFVFIDHDFRMHKSDIKEFVVAVVLMFFFSTPIFAPQIIFGKIQFNEPSLSPLAFNTFHRVYLLVAFAYLLGLTLLFRSKDKEYVRMCLLFITFVAMITYSDQHDFRDFAHPWAWPLHICNTAMFILPIALATKSEKVFYFTFFINILGAFLAIMMPNYAESVHVLQYRAIQFWQNHIEAAMMPLVCVLTGVFSRPTKKQFFYSMVGFAIYFVIVFVMNAVLTAYRPIYGAAHNGKMYEIPDFFFINSDFVAKKVHLEFLLYDFKFEFDFKGMHFVLYPLYQVLYFLGFIIMSIGMWFVYTWIFKAQDSYKMVHERYKKIKLDQIALEVKYNKKEVSECMSEFSKDKLVIQHFSKRYGDKAPFAVKDINFEANAGEIVGFLGPNGAGKSTTIKAIVGIHLPTEGTIEINGYDIVVQPVQAKAQLGFVPDHYALYENLTGREYLNYVADLYDVSQEERNAFLKENLEIFSMEKAIDNKMQTYSHGMKQKIAIMASIIHNPKLWILDEPLTGLDPVSIYQVKQCLKNHAEKGNIVFFSSHLIDIVEKLCDRIVIISDHKVQDIANVHDLLAKNINLEEYYMEKTGLVTGDK